MRIQEYTINKVTVDINTNSKKVADELKYSIDTFLTEEIFPLLESFFESVSSEEVIQLIPKLNLDIDIKNQNFSINSKTSKRELKKQISDKLEEISLQPEAYEVEIIEKTFQDSKADSFFSFLETGTLSWWNATTGNFNFTKKDLFEITETVNFSYRFLKVLQTASQKVRLFNQFFDEELHLLFLGISNKTETLNTIQKEITTNNLLGTNSEIKKELWNAFAETILRNDSSAFFEFLISKIQEIKNNESNKSVLKLKDFLQNKLLNKIEIFESLSQDISEKLEGLTVLKSFEKQERKLIDENKELVNKIKDSEETSINENSPILNQEIETNRFEKKALKISEKENLKIENNNTYKEEDNRTENQDNLNSKTESSTFERLTNKLTKDKIEESNFDQISNLKSQNLNNSSENPFDTNTKNLDKKEASKNIEKSMNSEIEKKQYQESFELGEVSSIQKRNSKGFKVNESRESDNEYLDFTQSSNILDRKQLKSKEELEKTKKKNPSELKNIKELFKVFNKPKSYIIKNAGLILIHPFLKQFFASCNLLNDKNEIIKPTEAVHLLHYVATKKEKQMESNLVFEKFLCNIPIHQTIERNITLSDEMKENAENLLHSITQNWEVLKNSSTDLIRNEFIQRQGKLDLTKDNPQITIERKTQDILLDKLPWNYGLCKLPWMKTLLFTDW